MELLTNQILAGIATGAIYACMALAVVMIYQAIDHLNFAQGEMAMFSTFISWQLMQWGIPYWGAFLLTLALSFAGGIPSSGCLFKPLAKAPILTNVAGFIALFAIINSVAGLIWDFTIKQYPTPFGSSPFLGSQLISTHQAGMIGVTVLLLILLYFFFQFTRIGLAMRAAASLPESARLVGINTSLDDRARLGHGGRDRLDRRHDDRAGGVSGAEHDGRRADLRICRRRARRPDQSVRRRDRRLPGRHLRKSRRHLHPRRRQ
jgi:branched-chain amino acid transport system permease protein